MNTPTLSKIFVFNENIDSEYLFTLYADDFPYVEEVFSITLQHFDQDLEALTLAWDTHNLPDLKKAVHKMKPAFGFLGLLRLQQQCKDFEDLCERVDETDEIKTPYKELMAALTESKSLIETEYRRLKDFNANPL